MYEDQYEEFISGHLELKWLTVANALSFNYE